MLFDAREFEHHFSDSLLKKGLRLFEKGLVEQQSRVGISEFNFLVDNRYDLFLKKKGDKVISYHCSCNKTAFCEHLCAVLFHFQKDALGISVKNKNSKPRATNAVQETKQLGSFLKDVDPSSLIKFIEEYAAGNPLFRETVLAYFSSGAEEQAVHFYSIAVKNVLASSASAENLQQRHLDEVHARLDALVSDQTKSRAGYRSLYYLRLAIQVELPAIFNARLTGDETALVKWLEHNSDQLDGYYFNDFSAVEKQAWLQSTLAYLKSNVQVYAPVFSFMLPRAISLLRHKEVSNEFKKLLERRHLKLVRSAGNLNVLEVIRLELAIKEAELFKTPFPFKKYSGDPELIIAMAELYFCNGKIEKAFKYLDKNYAEVKSGFPKAVKSFSDYIISKAKEKRKPEIELQYLERNFIDGLHIAPKEFERFLELVPFKKQSARLNELINQIKSQSKTEEIDKISVILLKAGRLNDLVKELKKQKNKFNLVNKIAVQSLPEYNADLLDLYLQHLVSALFEAKYTNYQQPLFLLAKKYLDKLPHKTANELVERVLKQIEFVKPLYNFILGYYPHALGNKVKNKII